MSHDVFISYAHQDKIVADTICSLVEARKIRCWIAPRDVLSDGNSNWSQSIIEAINNTKIVVMVFSSNANLSPYVPKEMERAASKGKPIIPFRIEDVMPSQDLELFISSQHWLDALTKPLEEHIEKLITIINSVLGAIETNEPITNRDNLNSSYDNDNIPTQNYNNGRQARETINESKSVSFDLGWPGYYLKTKMSMGLPNKVKIFGSNQIVHILFLNENRNIDIPAKSIIDIGVWNMGNAIEITTANRDKYLLQIGLFRAAETKKIIDDFVKNSR